MTASTSAGHAHGNIAPCQKEFPPTIWSPFYRFDNEVPTDFHELRQFGNSLWTANGKANTMGHAVVTEFTSSLAAKDALVQRGVLHAGLFEACIAAMEQLDREGFFGTGDVREEVVLLCQSEGTEDMEGSIGRLNTPRVARDSNAGSNSANEFPLGAWRIAGQSEASPE